jgi:hypothetical protein
MTARESMARSRFWASRCAAANAWAFVSTTAACDAKICASSESSNCRTRRAYRFRAPSASSPEVRGSEIVLRTPWAAAAARERRPAPVFLRVFDHVDLVVEVRLETRAFARLVLGGVDLGRGRIGEERGPGASG